METTVYQSNISIFHKYLDLLISSILNNNNLHIFLIEILHLTTSFINNVNGSAKLELSQSVRILDLSDNHHPESSNAEYCMSYCAKDPKQDEFDIQIK